MPLCFGPKIKHKKVVIFGLEDSGKTSLLYRLKCDNFVYTEPTIGYNCETIFRHHGKNHHLRKQDKDNNSRSNFTNSINSQQNVILKLNCVDLPGSKSLRLIWKEFLDEKVDGLIFMIDIDIYLESREYRENCKRLFWRTLDDNELLDTCPTLILLNKIDSCFKNELGTSKANNEGERKSPISFSVIQEIYEFLALSQIKNRSYELRPCSIKTGENIEEAIHWLGEVMLSKVESRDKIDVKDYNRSGNKIFNKINKKISSTNLSSTSRKMSKELDKQYPLTASISRTRKHVPFNHVLDQQTLKDKKLLELQKIEEKKKAKAEEIAKELEEAERKRKQIEAARPKWTNKLDNRLEQINSALSDARLENQHCRKVRQSMESVVAREKLAEMDYKPRKSSTPIDYKSKFISSKLYRSNSGNLNKRPQQQKAYLESTSSANDYHGQFIEDFRNLEATPMSRRGSRGRSLRELACKEKISTPVDGNTPILKSHQNQSSDISRVGSPCRKNGGNSSVKVKTPIMHVEKFKLALPPQMSSGSDKENQNIYPNLENLKSNVPGSHRGDYNSDNYLAQEFNKQLGLPLNSGRFSKTSRATSPENVLLPDHFTDRSHPCTVQLGSRPNSRNQRNFSGRRPRRAQLRDRPNSALSSKTSFTGISSKIELQFGDEAMSFGSGHENCGDMTIAKMSNSHKINSKLSQKDLRKMQFQRKYKEIFSSDCDD